VRGSVAILGKRLFDGVLDGEFFIEGIVIAGSFAPTDARTPGLVTV
jgi:hypothetical protein